MCGPGKGGAEREKVLVCVAVCCMGKEHIVMRARSGSRGVAVLKLCSSGFYTKKIHIRIDWRLCFMIMTFS